MGRLLGVDYGEKRIGLALSDPMGIIASPFQVLWRTDLEADIDRFSEVVDEQKVTAFVVGRPRHTDGREGEMVEKAESFVEVLTQRCPLPVHWIDETYTSLEAEELLKEQFSDWRDRKDRIDMVAAQIILRTHLDSLSRERP